MSYNQGMWNVGDKEEKILGGKRRSRAIIQDLSGCPFKDRLNILCVVTESNIVMNE